MSHTEELDAAAPNLPFGREPRIGVLVVAYNAARRWPRRSTASRRSSGRRSPRSSSATTPARTHLPGRPRLPADAARPAAHASIRHENNLGYGGNQKAGYQLAIEHDLDIVVLLHGDGQYAPELLPAMVEPLVRGEADAVFGSRMMEKGAARRGGMPPTSTSATGSSPFENKLLGSDLTEFHSGYRAYNVHALVRAGPLRRLRRLQLRHPDHHRSCTSHGKRIVEIPIPTYYGDEICYVNGMQYAADVVTDVVRYRLAKMGFSPGELAQVGDEYDLKEAEGSSHGRDPRAARRAARRRRCSTSAAPAGCSPSCSATAATT